MYGKLTAIVRYWMRYKQGSEKTALLSGLGKDITVKSIIGIPTLRQYGGIFDFGENTFVTHSINTRFSLKYEYKLRDFLRM